MCTCFNTSPREAVEELGVAQVHGGTRRIGLEFKYVLEVFTYDLFCSRGVFSFKIALKLSKHGNIALV